LADHLSLLSVAENKELLISLLSQKQSKQVFPLSLAQQRLWFLDQLNPGNPAYNVPFALHLRGNLNPRALQMGVQELVQRHETLRTRFGTEAGHPVQVVTANPPIEATLIDLTGIAESGRYAEAHRIASQQASIPFNLAAGPLLRLKLIRLAAEESILLCVMHHIVCDGWSLGILTRELSALYDQYSGGPCALLTTLRIQYPDYAQWQREWIANNVLAGQLQYWKRQLAGAPALLRLPLDNVRPAEQTYDGASQVMAIPEQLVHHLAELGRTRRATLFMVMLSVFKTLLHVYSGSNDILVGVPVAGRSHLELEPLIGFFVNTLVLRTNFSGDPHFADLLLQVREVALDAFGHAELPFEKLVEELNPVRSLSYSPLFQVMFSAVRVRDTPKFGNLTASPYILNTRTSLFDLSVEFIEDTDNRWWVRAEYATALFGNAQIRRMLEHYLTLLEAVATQPELRISRLITLLDGEGDVTQTVHIPSHRANYPVGPQREATGSLSEDADEPHDALQQMLVRIWERVLDTKRIGIHDSFFDLGGHSLLAAHLVSEVQKVVGRNIPVSALFRGSTIASFTKIIRNGTVGDPDPLAMELNKGTLEFPLFAIVQAGWDALGYVLLARHLGAEQPFYKLQAHAASGSTGPFTVEELRTMAREYIAAMRAVQPKGPYFIVGMCAGAHIAEQMVLELEAQGHEVGFFGIIDTFVLQYSWIRWLVRLESFRVGRRRVSKLPLFAQVSHYRQVVKRRLRQLFLHETEPLNPWDKAFWPGKEFHLEQFRAPVILFRKPRQPYFKIKDREMGWGARSLSGVKICMVNAVHEEMLREPAVQVIAEQLKDALHRSGNGKPSNACGGVAGVNNQETVVSPAQS
jgi:thioesterase domain-containing protein